MNAPSRLITGYLTSAATEVSVGVRGIGALGIQLAGTWTGTVTFEATIDGDTWVALNAVPSNSATAASTATSSGCWTANVAGFQSARARFSTATSGTVKATLLTTEPSGRY